MSLDELSIKHGTDKSSLYHNYSHTYDLFFSSYKTQNVNLLEVGVLLGNSLRVWKEYFSRGNIFGIDINPECKKYEEERIKIYIGDQTDASLLSRIIEDIKDIDIIIDDGSHIMDHQIKTFQMLFPSLKKNGLYIIEDLHTCYSPNPIFNNRSYTTFDFLKERVDDIQFNGKHIDDVWYGDKKNHFKTLKCQFELNYYEKWIKAIHFYKGICFIEKDRDWLNE